MKQKEKETTQYVPPEVDILQVQIELGFAASNAGSDSDPWDPQRGRWE